MTRTIAAMADPRGLPLFAGFELPEKPYCTKPDGDFKRGLEIRSLKTALTRPHVQFNPPWIWNCLIYDVDADDGERRWHDRELPMPRWNAINPRNGHSHTCYALKSPVLLGENCREAPLRWASAVESAMREKIGGDVQYAGLVAKNPLHPSHRTLWGRNAYELDELAAFLPNLGKHKPLPHVRAENYGIGRNVSTFDHVRIHAYREIRHHWEGGLDAWIAHLGDLAADYTGIEHTIPLDRTETRQIGRSIGKWTWSRMTPAKWIERQSWRGKAGGLASGKARRSRNAERDAEIIRLAVVGKVRNTAIAKQFGISEGAVRHIVKRGFPSMAELLPDMGSLRISKPVAKRRTLPPPGDLPATADMMPIEPMLENARRESARKTIANLQPPVKTPRRKWTRKVAKPALATPVIRVEPSPEVQRAFKRCDGCHLALCDSGCHDERLPF